MGAIAAALLKWLAPLIGKRILRRLMRRHLAGRIDRFLEQRGLSVEKRDELLDMLGAKRPRRRHDTTAGDPGHDDWHSGGA